MLKYSLKRILRTAAAFVFISFIVFLMIKAVSPKGNMSHISSLGSNSAVNEFTVFFKELFSSLAKNQDSYFSDHLTVLNQRFAKTFQLALSAALISAFAGIVLGTIAAYRKNTKIDDFIMVISLSATALPVFFIGYVFIYIFTIKLGVFSLIGKGGILNTIIPPLCLSLPAIGYMTRIVRTAMTEILEKNYIRAARGLGISEKSVVWFHGLTGALPPTITGFGLKFSEQFAGAVFIESIFYIPGLGTFLMSSFNARHIDPIPLYLAVIYTVFAILLMNLFVDLWVVFLNPRTHRS